MFHKLYPETTTLLLISWTLSMIFTCMNHPLSMGAILVTQTILVSLLSGKMFFSNFWFSYTLFLVMIGGMLVMFIYMTSIASNEKFSMPKYLIYLMISSLIIYIALILLQDKYFSLLSMPKILSIQQSNSLTNLNLSKFFNNPNMKTLIMLMIYLLVTLIAVVKISNKSSGTLRQK